MKLRTPPALLAVGLAIAVLVCVPLIYLVIRATSEGWSTVSAVLSRSSTHEAVATSLALAITVSLATLLVGVPIAWWLVRARLRMRAVWVVALTLPLAVPSFVAAFSWLSIFPRMQGFAAAWLVLTLATLPYVILPTAAAIRGIDPAHEEVARTLGWGPIASFRRAALPVIWPGVGGGVLLVFLYVLSDFGVVSILRVDTLSRAIYSSYRASFDRTSAAVLALLLALLAILVVAIEQRVRGRAQRWRIASSVPRAPDIAEPRVGYRALALAAMVGVVALGVGLPIVVSIYQMVVGTSVGIDASDLSSALGTTVLYGLIGMVVAVLFALPVGFMAARYPIVSARFVEQVAFVGHALPGVVVGLAIVFMGTRLTPALYQTLVMLAFAYLVLFLPKAGAAVRGSFAGVPPVLSDVARTLGASSHQAFWRVTVRMAAPGIAAGAVLVLLTVMKELPATLMLRPTGQETLATRLWMLTDASAYAAAAPYALALILVGVVPALMLAVPLVRMTRARRVVV